MFSHNTSVLTTSEKTFIPVVLTLVDGESLKGAIAITKNSRLGNLLNSADKYVLFKTNTGEPIYLALSTIAAVQSNEKPSTKQLENALKEYENLNPYHLLKVKPGVDEATLRNAYHTLVKQYHPDQFVNTNLPDEVLTYLDAVLLRLNAAYQEVIEEHNRLERLKALAAAANDMPDTGTIRYFGQ